MKHTAEEWEHDYKVASVMLDHELERRIEVEQKLRYERVRRSHAEAERSVFSWIAFVAVVLVAALLGYIALRGGL